ncbi:hypothetical protein ACJQWK_05013 [Exserohilum turcicum]
MRLLHIASDGALRWTRDIIRSEGIPPYAILSHTWKDGEEVTFEDLKNLDNSQGFNTKSKEGYQKLLFCGRQAQMDGLEYFWVDTCCIDKANSSELHEAINSMFCWYQNARKCYVFLSDLEINSLDGDGESLFRQSRWFRRGWTLQELLAPSSVEFFSKNGARLGDKETLKQIIHEITEIPMNALLGSGLSDFSVAERFAWTKNRETTREEDRAYCLFGIFGIHLPLIYGEGEENALKRLRRAAILKHKGRSHDQEKRLEKIYNWILTSSPSKNYHKALKQRQAKTRL